MKYNQREKFHLWFSFLKIAATDPPFLRGDIKWDRYKEWGGIQKIQALSFEKWWETYGKEIQNPVVKEVTSIPEHPPSNTVYLEIPLDRGPRRLLSRARHIILAKLIETYTEKEKDTGEEKVRVKSYPKEKDTEKVQGKTRFKRGFYGQYEHACFTEGREIRVEYYRNLLDLYAAVFRTQSGNVGMETLRTINVVATRNAERNAVRKETGKKQNAVRHEKGLKPLTIPLLPEFRIYTTAFMTTQDLDAVSPRLRLENYRQWMKRVREERAAHLAAGEITDSEWKPTRRTTAVDKRLDYQQNGEARRALLNLSRVKVALRLVVNAVARGEFPGPAGVFRHKKTSAAQ